MARRESVGRRMQGQGQRHGRHPPDLEQQCSPMHPFGNKICLLAGLKTHTHHEILAGLVCVLGALFLRQRQTCQSAVDQSNTAGPHIIVYSLQYTTMSVQALTG